MSSVDEPIFEAEETGESEILIEVPGKTLYIGAIPADAIESDMPTLYFDFEVARRLQFEGQRSITTDKEVAGILLGTSSGDGQQIKVSHIAVARDEDSSPVHFKFTYSVWDDLIDQMETLSRKAGEELLLLGWYHTHPNMSVFLSRYDLRTHRDFHRPYQFALVLAPRRGTADTTVGFFVNRQGGTPLLPGIHMYGATKRAEVTGSLPWRFQIVEAEGIEEGDGSDEDSEIDDTPMLHQVGVVRAEDADWLTLGNDPAEGPVTTILEGMAAAVVETHQDRIGVLLGDKTPDQHITITRVRFLGHLGEDPAKERRDLVGALRFMAQTFPATGDPKILGVVRIVSPHRFKEGDLYDPVENNIQIAMFLKEVGYDLDEVPFQVGLVLYPGIEEETVLFHVLAQNKMSRPVPLMSLQAISPPSEKPNERWEPIGEPVFEVDRDPCMTPPGVVPPSQIGTSAASARMKEMARTMDGDVPVEAAGTSSGIDWDELPDEVDGTTGTSSRRGVGVAVVVLGLLGALVLILVVLNVLAHKQDEARATPDLDPDEELLALGEPYSWSFTGCGPGWNPGVACDPFAQLDDGAETAELIRLQRKEAYVQGTIQPIEVWLIAEGTRRRHKLQRAKAGTGAYSFWVARAGEGWEDFWGTDNLPFPAKVVILPQGAELVLEDEMSWLRRTESIRLVAPPPPPEEDERPTHASLDDVPDEAPPLAVSAGEWRWKSGTSSLSTSYDTSRASFARSLELSGGSETGGSWRLRLRSARRGKFVATTSVVNPEASVGMLDLGRHATELMRDPAAVRVLEGKDVGAKVYIHITPPGSGSDLVAEVELTGGAPASISNEHRVCLMIMGPDELKLDGRARVGTEGVMRPSFDPTKGAKGECADGGATGRWTNVQFGPGTTQLEFIYEGPDNRPSKGVVQTYPLPKQWATTPGKCLAITIFVDPGGFQVLAPKIDALYDLVDGRCQ